jgi:hypothetical protein
MEDDDAYTGDDDGNADDDEDENNEDDGPLIECRGLGAALVPGVCLAAQPSW